MKKRWKMLAGLLVISLLVANGCGNGQKETESSSEIATQITEAADSGDEESQDRAGEMISVAGWNFIVEDMKTNASLENVSVELGYTGVETSDFVKAAEEGNVYCLIKLLIVKDGSTEEIDWAKFKLIDGEGNEYLRTEDEFITDLGMARMQGTALNFGTNEGWIAYEIPETATDLKLNYEFASERFDVEL